MWRLAKKARILRDLIFLREKIEIYLFKRYVNRKYF